MNKASFFALFFTFFVRISQFPASVSVHVDVTLHMLLSDGLSFKPKRLQALMLVN